MEATLKQQVEHILNQIRPQLQADGGNITLVDVKEDGTVWVELQGACGSCPHSRMTLKHGVEATLMKYVPGVTCVKDINLDVE